MLKNKFDSEAGFGIIQVLATLVIASVAIAGLFVTSYYVRQKATENYHTRVAMLHATEVLEKIRWFNRNNEGPVDVTHIPGLAGNVVIENRDNHNLMGIIQNPHVSYGQVDLMVAPYCIYDVVTVEVTWIEGAEDSYGETDNKRRSVVLREDYYRRADIGGE